MQLFFNIKIFKEYISHAMLKILKGGSLWSKTLWRWNLFHHANVFQRKNLFQIFLKPETFFKEELFQKQKTDFSVLCAFLDSSQGNL